MSIVKMANSNDLEKKGVVVDSSQSDARSMGEGDISPPRVALFDQATERKYREYF